MELQVALSLGVGTLEVVSYCTLYDDQLRPRSAAIVTVS